MTDTAVILARGLGTRMRKADAEATLTAAQAAAADQGVKAMIPIDRPFLDYVLHDLADCGFAHVVLVIGPEHEQVRRYYTQERPPRRLRVSLAIQEKPLGTADAVAAAQKTTNGKPFLMLNSDNYYPPAVLKAIQQAKEPSVAVFDRAAMIASSNIDPDRISKFAVVETDAAGYLQRVVEKPSPELVASLPEPVGVSMNCWRFECSIFTACRRVKPSVRGELEITDAVQIAMEELGVRFRVIHSSSPVLDMSSRADVASVARRLKGKEVRL